MLRIIAGTWRSRKLVQPATDSTRPMPDRVKAAIFSMLAHHYGLPGTLPPIAVADLFAGSGSLGLEALSRGAASCRFWESGPIALSALKANLASLKAGGNAVICQFDAWSAFSSTEPRDKCDLMFVDPPYVDSNDLSPSGRVAKFVHDLIQRKAGPMVIVLHHRKQGIELAPPSGSTLIDYRTYGSNAVTFLSL